MRQHARRSLWAAGVFVFAALLTGGLGSVVAIASPPGDAFRFVYDADGRLKAAIDPPGDTATYNWDVVGNLLSIDRNPSDELSILQLSPAKGEVGETIAIEGTGFSETPGSNTVKFNGTAATVEGATPWLLMVEVPAEATSGPVTVQTPEEGPVTGAQSFMVASDGPKISALEPTVAAAGEEVTISGSNFEPSPSDNVVGLNGLQAEIVSASSSSIDFKVPSGRLGAPVSLASLQGSDVGPDLFVPPSGVTVGKVGATGELPKNGRPRS